MLKQVTITGADDSIRPEHLLPLTERYPWVEWGILMSVKREGTPRFPSANWIGWMLRTIGGQLDLSAHLCGAMVRAVCGGDWSMAAARGVENFGRVQLNFHREPHGIDSETFATGLCGRQQIIFQADSVNEWLFRVAKSGGINAVPLFDLSGGKGVLRSEWPKPIPPYCGYAGGLSPENLEEQLKKIADAAGDCYFWIDCETHVRSSDDKVFDLAKVERFLAIAAKYVTKECPKC